MADEMCLRNCREAAVLQSKAGSVEFRASGADVAKPQPRIPGGRAGDSTAVHQPKMHFLALPPQTLLLRGLGIRPFLGEESVWSWLPWTFLPSAGSVQISLST